MKIGSSTPAVQSVSDSVLAPVSSDAVFDALALKLDANSLVQTITNGDTTHASSSDAVFDALALKATVTQVNNSAIQEIQVACSDETTDLTTGTSKVTFRMPYAFTLTGDKVRASLSTAQPSGSILTVDINETGTSILSTKLTIDNTEKTSVTAATPAVVSDSSLADNAEITVDIDQIGDTGARGLKIILIGTRT